MRDARTDNVRLEARKWAAKLRAGYLQSQFWADASPDLRVLASQRLDATLARKEPV